MMAGLLMHEIGMLIQQPPFASISWVPCINLPLHRLHSSWQSDVSDVGIRLWCRVSSPTAAQPWIWGPCPFIKQLDHIKFSFSQWAELWACLLSQCNASISCPLPQTVQCTVLKVIPFSLPCIHLHTDVLYFWVNLSVNTNFSYEAIWVKFIFISFFSLFPLSLLFNYAYTLYIVIFLHVDSLLYNNACIHDMNTCTPFSLLSPPPPLIIILLSDKEICTYICIH